MVDASTANSQIPIPKGKHMNYWLVSLAFVAFVLIIMAIIADITYKREKRRLRKFVEEERKRVHATAQSIIEQTNDQNPEN